MKFFEKFISEIEKNYPVTTERHQKHPMLDYRNGDTELIKKYIMQCDSGMAKMEMESAFKDWGSVKKKEVIDNTCIKNISSVLGEIRALGLIHNSFLGVNLKCSKKNIAGADFYTTHYNDVLRIAIEVNTPLGRDKEERTTNKINDFMTEFSPFGLPAREYDTNQSEVISKIASIKDDEHQFKIEDINILFLDFVNPFLYRCGLDLINEQYKPYMKHDDGITWGALWHAFYAKKNDIIVEQFNCEGIHEKGEYKMEFDGRFQRNSKIDFIILNLVKELVIYENIQHEQVIDNETYLALLSLPGSSLENSFLN
jgi:hypothetical protein